MTRRNGGANVEPFGADADLHRRSGGWANRTIAETLRAWAARRPNVLAVASVEGTLTRLTREVIPRLRSLGRVQRKQPAQA